MGGLVGGVSGQTLTWNGLPDALKCLMDLEIFIAGSIHFYSFMDGTCGVLTVCRFSVGMGVLG